eukprot:m.26465 g.26465  ORF g.26465 m.26465 type:complete len:377 (-) comp6314_c0_seq1:809-1939(-)
MVRPNSSSTTNQPQEMRAGLPRHVPAHRVGPRVPRQIGNQWSRWEPSGAGIDRARLVDARGVVENVPQRCNRRTVPKPRRSQGHCVRSVRHNARGNVRFTVCGDLKPACVAHLNGLVETQRQCSVGRRRCYRREVRSVGFTNSRIVVHSRTDPQGKPPTHVLLVAVVDTSRSQWKNRRVPFGEIRGDRHERVGHLGVRDVVFKRGLRPPHASVEGASVALMVWARDAVSWTNLSKAKGGVGQRCLPRPVDPGLPPQRNHGGELHRVIDPLGRLKRVVFTLIPENRLDGKACQRSDHSIVQVALRRRPALDRRPTNVGPHQSERHLRAEHPGHLAGSEPAGRREVVPALRVVPAERLRRRPRPWKHEPAEIAQRDGR